MPDRLVLHLTAMRSSKYGGLEQYFVHLAEACRIAGYRTVLQYESLPASDAYRQDLHRCGATLVTFPTLSSPFRSVPRVTGLLRDLRPDIVHSHFVDGYVLLAIPHAARRRGARKVISTLHNPLGSRRTWHRRISYNWHDHVLGVSEDVSRSLRRAGVRASVLATHYLGLFGSRRISSDQRARTRSEFGIPEDAPVIGCIGYDTPRKGFDALLRALERLVRGGRPAHLIAVGIDPDRSRLPARAADLGVTKYAHWAGVRDEGWRLMGAVDVYTQPSLSEGLPLGVMEAMAIGLPVVASAVGGIPEAVVHGETGLLTSPDDPDALATALKSLLDDPLGMRRMGEAGHRRFGELFSGENSVDLLVKKYYGLSQAK